MSQTYANMYVYLVYTYLRWKVRLGDNDLSSSIDDDSVEERDILSILVHPKYVKGESYFDIGLLKVEEVELSAYIRPGNQIW